MTTELRCPHCGEARFVREHRVTTMVRTDLYLVGRPFCSVSEAESVEDEDRWHCDDCETPLDAAFGRLLTAAAKRARLIRD